MEKIERRGSCASVRAHAVGDALCFASAAANLVLIEVDAAKLSSNPCSVSASARVQKKINERVAQHLLEAGREHGAVRVSTATVANIAEANLPGRDYGPGVDQALAIEKIATSGRVLDVLVGPGGTGKSTTMAGLRAAWELSLIHI